jgi:hypothetical protein
MGKFMHYIIIALLLCIGLAALALAQNATSGRAFPPDNCSGTNPFMAFNGVATGGNTYCINGQSVLSNALPGCAPNQQVIYDGTSFICQDPGSDLNIPACGAGQFLTYNGTSFSCGSTNVPAGGGSSTTTVVYQPGMWCGSALAVCNGPGSNNASYRYRVPCQGSNLSVSCSNVDGSPYYIPTSWTGCPAGFVLTHFEGSFYYGTGGGFYGTAACVKN